MFFLQNDPRNYHPTKLGPTDLGKFWKSIIDSKRLVLGGSSQLGSVVNNHGDRFRPLRIGLLNDPLP